MNTVQRLIQPLHHALQVFFARDVQLRRGESGVELVLADRSAAAQAVRQPSRAEQAQSKERAELKLMQAQLAAVLDELPGTRAGLRHLAFVEQALLRKGWKALHKLPLDVLQRALEQLEGLVTNWSPEGLANLRSKVAVAIIDREHTDPDAEADLYRTTMPLEAQERAATVAHLAQLAQLSEPAADTMPAAAAEDINSEHALAAAYAALGLGGPGAAPAPTPTPAPTPASLAAQALAQVQASSAATVQAAAGAPGQNAAEALEYHPELGSHSARAQPRENLAGKGRLAPIKLRELQT